MNFNRLLENKVILITGGTGSFGNKFVEMALKYNPKKIIIYSRDEYKQYIMRKKFFDHKSQLRFFIGDIRDKSRLYRAFESVDYVIHAAALKQVPALEYNPTEAVNTNVMGADNVVDAAIDNNIKKVISLSTDKAVNPINLYGATKLVAEKIFIAANVYAGGKVKFSGVRYGNVMGSRGSIIPFFLNLKNKGVKKYPITDKQMTRFWITLKQSVLLVFNALFNMIGGEIFIPQIPSMKITDLARAIDPECDFEIIGIRPGEKLHENLISVDEARNTRVFRDTYLILPSFDYISDRAYRKYKKYPQVISGFSFSSNKNDSWLTASQLKKNIQNIYNDDCSCSI